MDAVKEESNGSAKSKLRHPLRSATKSKDDKSVMADTAKRGKPASNVRRSVSVLNTSEKDKSAKPPKRLSVPTKSSISPLPRSTSTKTPISETRTARSTKGQGSTEKSVSDVSKSVSRRKFSVLSSVSYWLSQIKLSESAAKHSVSLGFFKLALESGCEPLQRMRDELKSYVRRHNLVELGESMNELLISYNILEEMEKLQDSQTCSQAPGETTQFSEGVYSSSSDGSKNLRPKSLSSKNVQTSSVAKPAKRGSLTGVSERKNRGSVSRNSTKSHTAIDIGGGHPKKKSQRPARKMTGKETTKIENQGEYFVEDKVSAESLPAMETEEDDKENKDTQQPETEEASVTELVVI